MSAMPADQRTPGFPVNQSFSGTTNVGTGLNTVYLFGEFLATGTVSEGDVSGLITTQAVASALAGPQSILAFMAAEALNEDEGGDVVPIKLVAVAEPAAGVAANQTFTYVGVADSLNTHSINIGGKTYSWSVPATTTATAAGDLLAAAVNLAAANGDHPWSAANAAGTVTATCKHKGTIGNAITTSVLTIGEEGTQTLTAGAATMASGTLEPTLTVPLAALDEIDTDFLAVSMVDTTSLETIRSHLATKGAPPEQASCVGIWADRLSVAGINNNADTIDANGLAFRMLAFDVYNTDSFPPAMAAGAAVVLASEEDCARPHNGLGVKAVKAPTTGRFVNSECETLLANGVTPGRTDRGGTVVKIVRSVCVQTNLLDPMDITKIRTLDELRDRIVANWEKLDRPKLKKDGEPVYTSNTVTAASVTSMAKMVYRAMEMQDKVQGYETGKLSERFKGVYSGPGITESTIPSDCVDGFHVGKADLVMQLS